VIQLLAMTPVGGRVLVPPPSPARHIEFIGDSIACGQGELGAGPLCASTPANEDATMAYPSLVASALGAEPSVIAYAGIGAYRSRGGPPGLAMPVLHGRSLPDDAGSTWAFESPAPEVVVIDLGTNDFAADDPGEAFERGYLAFLGQIRSHYPEARIVCVLGAMLTDASRPPGLRTKARKRLTDVVRQRAATDSRVSFFEFDEQKSTDGYGCDGHPSYVTHQRMAAKLVAALRPLMSW
jgi:lysophospholipase L1-like esterase